MRKHKKLLYIGLGVLAVLVVLMGVIWNFSRDETYLIMMGILSFLFLCYFVLMVFINSRTGWNDENTPYSRVRSEEKLLLHLYPLKGNSYVLALYAPFDAKLFIEWLKTEWEKEDSDMGPLGSAYLGWTKIKDYRLPEVKNNTVVLPAETEKRLRADPDLADFFKQNNVLPY